MFINLFLLALIIVLALVVGAFIGVGLARRSTTANELYDRARNEADELRERLREAEAKLRSKE